MIIYVQKIIYGRTYGQPKTIVRNLTKLTKEIFFGKYLFHNVSLIQSKHFQVNNDNYNMSYYKIACGNESQ